MLPQHHSPSLAARLDLAPAGRTLHIAPILPIGDIGALFAQNDAVESFGVAAG
jgi:hypothetical protein